MCIGKQRTKKLPSELNKIWTSGEKMLMVRKQNLSLSSEKIFLWIPYFKIKLCFPFRKCGKHLFKMSLEGHPILQRAVFHIFWATDVERYSMVFSLLQVDVVWQSLPSFSFLTFYQEWVEGQEFLPDSFPRCSHLTPSHPKWCALYPN